MSKNKVIPFPGVREALFFLCGFMIGCFAPIYAWDFLKSINKYASAKLAGAISVYYNESSGGLNEGDPVIFFLIAMLALSLKFIKSMITFIWGILFGYFIRTLLVFFQIDKSFEFLGQLLGTL